MWLLYIVIHPPKACPTDPDCRVDKSGEGKLRKIGFWLKKRKIFKFHRGGGTIGTYLQFVLWGTPGNHWESFSPQITNSWQTICAPLQSWSFLSCITIRFLSCITISIISVSRNSGRCCWLCIRLHFLTSRGQMPNDLFMFYFVDLHFLTFYFPPILFFFLVASSRKC